MTPDLTHPVQPGPSESLVSALHRLVQPPPHRPGDVGCLGCSRSREVMQTIEHPLQGDQGPVAVRAVVDVTLKARSAPRRQVAIDEIGEMFGGPAVIAAEPRAGDKVDHSLELSGRSLDLVWRATVPLNLSSAEWSE